MAEAPGADAAASARNDRYLREIVESWQSCPYARGCREQGRLWRAVCWAEGTSTAAEARIAAQLDALEERSAAGGPGGHPEVALLLLPGMAELDAATFDALHQRLRDAYQARFAQPRFYVVAFHPSYPTDARSPSTLVRLFRRSPDPTLQLVDRATLAPLRRPGDEAERIRRASELVAAGASAEELAAALRPPRDLSAVVAEANAARFDREGGAMIAQLEALLAEAAAARAALKAELASVGRRPSHLADSGWTTVR